MKILSLSLVMVLALSTASVAADPGTVQDVHAYSPVPVGPSARPSDVSGILAATRFTLKTPYAYLWREDHPAITSGWVLVVGVTPDLAVQRDTFNPVLYVGRYPAEIAATDSKLGRMVVIVPGDVDLARDPIYFGSMELPSEVSAERAGLEMSAAITAGFGPVLPEMLRLALEAGGESIAVGDSYELYAGPVAHAIEEYAPAQLDRAEMYRSPRLGTR